MKGHKSVHDSTLTDCYAEAVAEVNRTNKPVRLSEFVKGGSPILFRAAYDAGLRFVAVTANSFSAKGELHEPGDRIDGHVTLQLSSFRIGGVIVLNPPVIRIEEGIFFHQPPFDISEIQAHVHRF